MKKYYMGVDVGKGREREGMLEEGGKMIEQERRDIEIWREEGGIVEKQREDIWKEVCESVREVVRVDGVDKEEVEGIGYDEKC